MDAKGALSLEEDDIDRLIRDDSLTVSVIGIGRIGLPTALSFAKSGIRTIGVDINENLIKKISDGLFPLKDEPGYEEIFYEAIKDGRFSATSRIEDAVPNSQIILLTLPTSMDSNNIPDYTALRTVGKQLKSLVRDGSIIIIESTIEPGFIENEFLGMIARDKIGVGVCPETANPGEIMRDFARLPRLVGATDEKTARIIKKIYEHVFRVELVLMPDCKSANAVKLTTNVFRDMNIALVNELAMLFEKLGIDTQTVLEAADRKYNFQLHHPGAGVGGPCLPVCSYQMLNSSKKAGADTLKIVRAGREVNEQMPYHVVKLTGDALAEAGKSLDSANILILGISYKPNVKDIQLSPAETIITELKKSGSNVLIFDPYFRDVMVYGIKAENTLENAISQADAAVLVTAHREFEDMDSAYFASKMRSPVLIDARGMVDAHEAKKSGLIFRGLGRG